MQQYLHKYFSLYRQLTLPGIGTFTIHTKPAQLDFINKTLNAPLHTILYNSEADLGDERFFDFLSTETDLNKNDATEKFMLFSDDIKAQLESGNSFELRSIGTLRKTEDGFSFVPDNSVQSFFPEVIAEKVIRQNAEHRVTVGEHERTSTQMHEQLWNKKEEKKERWWIAAIVLGTIGAAAIALHYVRN